MASSAKRSPSRLPFSTDPTSRALLARRGDVDELLSSFLDPKGLMKLKRCCTEATRMIKGCSLREVDFLVVERLTSDTSAVERWRRAFPSAKRVTVQGITRAGLRSLAGVPDVSLIFGRPHGSRVVGQIGMDVEAGDWSSLAGVRRLSVCVWWPPYYADLTNQNRHLSIGYGKEVPYAPVPWMHAQAALTAAAPSLETLEGSGWGVDWAAVLPLMTRLRAFDVGPQRHLTAAALSAVAPRLTHVALYDQCALREFAKLQRAELHYFDDPSWAADLAPTCTEVHLVSCADLGTDAASHLRHVRKFVCSPSGDAFTDEVLQRMEGLEQLVLRGANAVTGACFARLPSLRRVSLNHCRGITDTGLAFGKDTITELTLVNMGRPLGATIGSWTWRTGLTGWGVGALARLQTLRLVGCGLGDHGLERLVSLREASITSCSELTDATLAAWASTLKELTVADCPKISPAGVDACTQLSAPSLAYIKALQRPSKATRSRRGRGRA